MTRAISLADGDSLCEPKRRVLRQPSKATQRKKLLSMGELMVREGGLLNVAQTATFLDVSRERVYELLELKLLTKYEVLGRVYLSFNEIKARMNADVKAGRPPRTRVQRWKVGLKTVAKTDLLQALHGGPFPSDEDVEAAKKRKKQSK